MPTSSKKREISPVAKTQSNYMGKYFEEEEDMLIEEIKKDEWPKNPIDSSRL
jgi:hypothetical protein